MANSAIARLEVLLERVQRRAQEPRPLRVLGPAEAEAPLEPVEVGVGAAAIDPRDRTVARALPRVRAVEPDPIEDEIEEYDDELIEIVDDGDSEEDISEVETISEVEPISEPPVAAHPVHEAPSVLVQPSASAPSLERRAGAPLRAVAAPAAHEPEVVGRPLAEAVAVARSVGHKRPLSATSFREALMKSLSLGG